MDLTKSLLQSLLRLDNAQHRRSTESPTPVLLGWRMTALGLNPKRIGRAYPDVYRDLKTTCRACPVKQRCLEDMMESANPPGWESYCPNSGTLRTLL